MSCLFGESTWSQPDFHGLFPDMLQPLRFGLGDAIPGCFRIRLEYIIGPSGTTTSPAIEASARTMKRCLRQEEGIGISASRRACGRRQTTLLPQTSNTGLPSA